MNPNFLGYANIYRDHRGGHDICDHLGGLGFIGRINGGLCDWPDDLCDEPRAADSWGLDTRYLTGHADVGGCGHCRRGSERIPDYQAGDRGGYRQAMLHGHLTLLGAVSCRRWHAVAQFQPAHIIPPGSLRRHLWHCLADYRVLRCGHIGRYCAATGSNDQVARYSSV